MGILTEIRTVDFRVQLARLRTALIDVAFPKICAGCGSRGSWLCTYCEGTVPALAEPKCDKCGMPKLQGFGCWCRNMNPSWSQSRSAFPYSGWAAGSVKRLKYQDEFDRANHMASLMAPLIGEMGRFDALVPVPLHRSRLDERGFNQSELLALAISRLSEIPVQPMLVKTLKTPQQASLSRDDRKTNLNGAFAIADGWVPTSGEQYLLIDDVKTSGATLSECAMTLVVAGSAPVSSLTFAMDYQPAELAALMSQRGVGKT